MSRPVPEIARATVADARELGPILNADDRREVEALFGREPASLLVEAVERSAEAWTARVNGDLVCMWGIVPTSMLGYTGVPWLLGTDLVQRHRRELLTRSRVFVERWRQQYPEMKNVVDSRHERAKRWLSWLGFDLKPAVPMGVAGLPFHPFEMMS